MDSSQQEQQQIPPHLEQKKLVEFLESLQRIFKIGTYYPAGHAVLDQAVAQFQRNLGQIADTNRSVIIDLKGETLSVEDYEIVTETSAVRGFKQLLLDLGLGRVEIDRAIIISELMQFIRGLLRGRAQLQGIKQFTQADIPDLPASVRIRQKEFLVDEGGIALDGNGEDAEHGLNSVFQVLAEQGLERVQIEQCKKFLNSLSERFSNNPINIKGLPAVSWGDVRGLLVKVITNAYQMVDDSDRIFVQNDLNALSAIFNGLERELQDKESRETISLLVSVFGRGTLGRHQDLAEGGGQGKGLRPGDNVPGMSAGQLQSFVNQNFVQRKILEKINKVDRREELAILLQLLQYQQDPVVESRIRQNMRDILTTSLTAKEVEVLVRGILQLLEGQDTSRFRDAVLSLAAMLRGAKNLSAQQFLVMICRKIDLAGQSLIWAIIVNEMLAGGRSVDQRLFAELVTIAGTLPGSEMRERWQELEAMDSFQEKKIAAEVFDPGIKSAYLLYSFLLETSLKKQIGVRVLTSLMADPPDWLIEAVAPLLQLAVPQHMKFLQTYLLVAQQKEFPVSMRMAAGNFVVHSLPEISEQQRNESWVAKTIEALPEMQVEETRSLLERILEEKKMMVVPKWPNACRKAAAEALKNLKRKPL